MNAIPTLPRRYLGKSGISVSEIGIGCWAIGGPDWNLGMEMGWGGVNERNSLAGLECAFSLGANHFDTADIYGHGQSERLIGKLLHHVQRDQIVIGSKVGYFRGTAPNAYDPLHMRHQLEMTLRNLGTDYLDIYYLHNFHFGEGDEYLEGAIQALHAFKKEGKIRAIGMRGPHRYAPDRYRNGIVSQDKYQRFLSVAAQVDPDVVQVRYNLLSPRYDTADHDIFAWSEERNIGVVINKPFAQGLLLDKYDPDALPEFPPGDHRRRKRWFTPQGVRILRRRLKPIKDRYGSDTRELVRVALQYCLHRSPKACVLAGFKNAEQVAVNLQAAGKHLTRADSDFLHRIMADVGADLGSYFDTEVKRA